MRAAIGILLALLAAGCVKEIRRGEFRPDGLQYVSGGMAGKKKRAPSFFEKLLQGPSGKPAAGAAAKHGIIRAGQGARASAQPAETEKARSFWDRLFRRKPKAKERSAPKEGK